MDWKTTVDQLMRIDRVPQDRLKAQQSKSSEKQAALDKVQAAVSALNTAASGLDLGSLTTGPRASKITSSLALKSTAIPVVLQGTISAADKISTTSPLVAGITGYQTANGDLTGVYFSVSGSGITPGTLVKSVTLGTNGAPSEIEISPQIQGQLPVDPVWLTFNYSGAGYETTTVPLSDPGTVTSEDGATTGSYEVRVLEPATETVVFGGNNGLVPDSGQAADTQGDGYQFDCLTLSDYGVLENDTLTVNGTQYTITAADLALSAKAFLTARGGSVKATVGDETTLRQRDGKLQMEFSNGGLVPFLGSKADSGDVLAKLGVSYTEFTNGTAIYSQKMPGDALAKIKLSAFGSGSGSFSINGESISFAGTETVGALISKINNSDAGVVAELDSDRRRLVLRSLTVGGGPISLSDGGGLLQKLKVEASFSSQEDVTQQAWNPQDGDSPYDASDTATYYKLGTSMTYTLVRNGKPVGSSNGSTLLVDGSNVGTFTASGNTVDLSVHGFGKTKLSVTQAGTYKFQVSGAENNGSDKFDALIKAYNDLRTQILDVTKVTVGSDGKVTTAILSGNRDLVNLLSTVRSRLFSAVEDPGSLYGNFSSSFDRLDRLGITFDRNGVLSVTNSAALTAALRDNPSRVNALFNSGSSSITATGTLGNDYFTASSVSNLAVGQALTGSGIPSGALVASIDANTSRVYLKNAAGNAVTLTGNLSASAVYLPVLNQGLAVRLKGLASTVLDTSTTTPGLFKNSTNAIASQNKTLQRQIDTMERQLAARKAALERSFIAMEQAQSRSQSLLSQLTNSLPKSS